MTYSTAALVPSASICTKGDPENTTVTVKAGDTLTGLVLQHGRREKTIETATVKGFIGGNRIVARGETTVWDGIPTYRHDPEGDAHFGTIDELIEIRAIVIEIPAETEGGKPEVTTVRVADIKAINATPAVTDQTGTEPGPDAEDAGDSATE
ncbi:MAG: hypothetical protein NC311_05880 [Muribaculaceae bacterium]|nr:hypothetical protein [Muribaculaceae bacterium]